ncbi:MAG: helix-turn-helix domain-containing protein [Actinomycetota bacterium]
MSARAANGTGVAARSSMVVNVVAGTHTATRQAEEVRQENPHGRVPCCTLYHQAVELVGKRWTGAILLVMMDGPLRFSEIRVLVPELSDRLLSERLKELEGERIVERREESGCTRVEYALTDKGQALEPAVSALKHWARSYR